MRTILTAALAAAAFIEVGAQTRPAPPAPPARPAPTATPAPSAVPAPAARPSPAPRPPILRAPEVGDLWNGHVLRADELHFDFDFSEMQHALELSRLEQLDVIHSLDLERLREESLQAVEMSRMAMEDARLFAMDGRSWAPTPLAIGSNVYFGDPARRGATLSVTPREAWLSQDQADSLYRAARNLLTRSQYRTAAETFRQISQRYPSSGYTPDAMYFEAYSLYKIGGQNELRQALDVLQRQKTRFPNTNVPDPGLLPRIQGELASRGDANAAAYVATTAARQGQSCNKDDMAIRLEALNALSRMNVDSTTPILRRVLARRDECSISLRRQAITLMAKNPDAATADVIIDVVKNDPAIEVRRAAVSWLGEVPSERGAAALDEILRSPKDEELHASALRALASSRNPRASQALRSVIERKDVSENLRRSAMQTLARTDSAGAGAYLRSLFPRLESRRLKEEALTQIARLRGDDNQRWMLAFVRDTTEPVELRRSALQTLTRSSATPVADIGGLFRSVPELELRQAIISNLGSRKEDEAVDQLIAIYRVSNDPKLNVQIINVLSRRDDPRTIKLLAEILNK